MYMYLDQYFKNLILKLTNIAFAPIELMIHQRDFHLGLGAGGVGDSGVSCWNPNWFVGENGNPGDNIGNCDLGECRHPNGSGDDGAVNSDGGREPGAGGRGCSCGGGG